MYELEDLDTGMRQSIIGRELIAGVRLHIITAPGSTLLIYREEK